MLGNTLDYLAQIGPPAITVEVFPRNEIDRTRDVEAEAGSGGSGPFSVEAEARKFYRFRFHIGYFTWRKILSISQCGLNGEVAL